MIGVPALATLSKILDHQRTEAYSQPQFNVPATGPGEKRHHGQERYVKMSTHSREDIYIYIHTYPDAPHDAPPKLQWQLLTV